MNRGAKAGVIGVCCAGLLGLGGVGAYNIIHGLTGSSGGGSAGGSAGPAAQAQSTAPPAAAQAVKVAQAFLGNWQAGPADYTVAANSTNSPTAAQSDLANYRSGLKLSSVSFSRVTAAGPSTSDPGATVVDFTVTAKVAGGTWTYPGSLNVIQNNGGLASVDWSVSVLYSGLTAGETLAAGPVTATGNGAGSTATVLAADGSALTAAKYPSLAGIISALGSGGSAAGNSGGSGGSGVEVLGVDGSPQSIAKTFTAPVGMTVKTTIDPRLQAVAEQAVQNPELHGLPTSVVVLDPATGHILAVANANTGSNGDMALDYASPPGSTMKIITSAALFDMDGLTPQSPAPCPLSQVANSQNFTNESDVPQKLNATVEWSFAESCNTAFITDGYQYLVHHNTDATDLSTEATQVFGLVAWNIGGGLQISTAQVPADPTGSNNAADLIGQGQVEMSPLDMASVAATVSEGAFHQPVILPGLSTPGAATPMNQTTAQELRDMMRFDATSGIGTASPRLSGIPDAGGKTGTAQVGDGNSTNGWFTAFDDKIAVASMVQGGSSGAGTAGYVVEQLLEADE